MPVINTGDINTYYEIHGEGPPLLLINGYGDYTGHWFRMLPWLTSSFRTLIYDNRGAGRSDKPDIPYTMELLADDAVGLLQALGITRTHVFGVSMGGMVAQELALHYPEKVDHLVLGCTMAGGANTVYPDQEVLAFLLDEGKSARLSPAEIACKMWSYTCTESFRENHPEVGEEYIRVCENLPAPEHGLKRQGDAIAAHNTYDRLPGLTAPTLVMAGAEDRLVPPENSRILAGRIPGSEITLMNKTGHGFFYESVETAGTIINNFILHTR